MYEPQSQKGLFGTIALWVIGLVVLVSVISGVLWGVGVLGADVKGRGEARKQIKSADFRIAAYDHFYNLCASIQANEISLGAQEDALAGATGDDRERIAANVAGLRATIGGSIAQYNVDARKSYTVGQFKSSDLPYQLDQTTKGTSCES